MLCKPKQRQRAHDTTGKEAHDTTGISLGYMCSSLGRNKIINFRILLGAFRV